jgi:KilA-N domain
MDAPVVDRAVSFCSANNGSLIRAIRTPRFCRVSPRTIPLTAVQSTFPVIRGRTIRVDENNLLCLNDIWQAAGFSKNQKPSDWSRLPMVTQLHVAVLERTTGKSRSWTKTEFRSVLYAKMGKGGGTYADIRLALAYAEYLNPKLALEVKEVFLRYKAADPTLADDVLQRASTEANEWAGRRALSRVVRNGYTATLSAHGVRQRLDFAICTNALYEGLFRRNAKQLKADKGIISGGFRDAMAAPCTRATSTSARFIRDAIEGDRRDRRERQQGLI